MISCGYSEIAAPKMLKIVRKTYVVEFPFNSVTRIQSTAYYWSTIQIHFGSAQKGKS